MRFKKSIILSITLLFIFGNTYAIPAYPFPKVIHQPDGTDITVIKKGDEHFHYFETLDGYLITPDEQGVFFYANVTSEGKIKRTPIKANDAPHRKEAEKQFIKRFNKEKQQKTLATTIPARQKMLPKKTTIQRTGNYPKEGSPRSLVILVNFKDKDIVIPNPQLAFTNLLNEENYSENGATGSARDYFRDNTMGVFNPQFDVVGPYTLPHNSGYYGENDNDGYDKRATNLIVDACHLADSAGIDYTTYDTDNDGIIDNVFVYYAGYNEAEWGGDNTVWPHRWSIFPKSSYGSDSNYDDSSTSITFDGKTLFDYACTSELKGDENEEMCGIATFTHEFGHVLGLADLYATDGSSHHTISDWSIMDAGVYLNEGRTPPGYSAFERFQLGFITPDLLVESENKTLEHILTSNKAYLITENNEHNLIGDNPSPSEFFLLENRQNTGWDTYLPGHGLLVYRINYDKNAFWENSPNNNPNAMSVDIIEADKKADDSTLSGDPFPGTSGKEVLSLTLLSGKKIHKQLTEITEADNIINFSYKNEASIMTDSTSLHFMVGLNTNPQAKSLTVTTNNINEAIQYEIIGSGSIYFSAFGTGELPSNGGNVYINFKPVEEGQKSAKLKIWSSDITVYIDLIGNTPITPLEIPVVPENTSTISITNNAFTAIWEPVDKAESYLVNIYRKSNVNEDKVVLTENFDAFTRGKPNSHVSSTDIANQLDDYFTLSSWEGKKIFEAGGAIKLGSSSKYGSLTTPSLDLSGNNGNFIVEFDAMAWSNDAQEFSIYRGETLAYQVKNLNNQSYRFNHYSILLSNGTSSTKISFEGSNLSKSRFFLDNIVIKQGEELVSRNIAVENSPFTSSTNNFLYTNTLQNSESYYYTVKAIKGDKESGLSKEVGPIKLNPTGVNKVLSSDLELFVVNGKLIVTANENEVIEIFNALGQKLINQKAGIGANQIDLPDNGIFIIKVGNRVGKVVL